MKNKVFIIFILLIIFFPQEISNKAINIILRKLNTISEITLTIQGDGYQYILNPQSIIGYTFNCIPSEVLINGELQNFQDSFEYYMPFEISLVSIKWNYSLIYCDAMFYGMTNITEIYFSYFDSSQVKSMYKMFSGCTNLLSINLNKLDTSLVTDMRDIFYLCKSLTSLDITSFNTSLIDNIYGVFSY